MGKVNYVDLCAGIGGTRSGLDNVGWKCLYSADHDAAAVEVHRLAHGDCAQEDITKLDPRSIPNHDVLVAGFPCQPFSSSGYRSGFAHSSGGVFEGLLKLLKAKKPAYALLENVQGLLSNQYGYSFAQVLLCLTELNYSVEWMTINASDLGIPQNRPRLFIIAKRRTGVRQQILPGAEWAKKSIFSSFASEQGMSVKSVSDGDLELLSRERDPKRKKRHTPVSPFAKAGFAIGTSYINVELSKPTRFSKMGSLGAICCPKFRFAGEVRSARYWAHSGKTEVYIKSEPISHCLGTSIGAPPIFCIDQKLLKTDSDKKALLEFANWSKESKTHLLFRLVSDRAVYLFGGMTSKIAEALRASSVTSTVKYRLVGNMVAPQAAFLIGGLIEQDMKKEKVRKSSLQATA